MTALGPGRRTSRLLVVAVVLSAAAWSAAPPDESAYSPVAPARALHAALRINLKIAQDWLNDNDFASAGQTAQGVIVLAQLYGFQSTEKPWQQRTRALAEAAGRLLAATRKKDAAGCAKSAQDCAALLAELDKHPPAGPKAVVKNFATFGSTKTWMLLMDGAYVDAKAARTPAELRDCAHALAEILNVSSHLRSESRWRTMAFETRRAALAVAAQAEAGSLEEARRGLKAVSTSCEACHQGYKK